MLPPPKAHFNWSALRTIRDVTSRETLAGATATDFPPPLYPTTRRTASAVALASRSDPGFTHYEPVTW